MRYRRECVSIPRSNLGSTIIYKPGVIVGGTHSIDCPLSRGLGYWIEPILLLAPFGKNALSITFKGITSSNDDLGVDTIRTSIFPVMEKFGIHRQELRIVKRGASPLGGGEVVLHLPHLIAQPDTLHATYTPNINKIRGIAFSTRVSPASVNRIVDTARQVLKPTNCETFIFTDVARGDESGKSPGFGVTLVAETKNGWAISAEGVGNAGSTPEDLGQLVASKLLQEISLSGVVGRNQVQMALVFMLLGKEDIGRLCIGAGVIDEKFVGLLRYIKQFWGLEVLLKQQSDAEYLCSVKGSGFIGYKKTH